MTSLTHFHIILSIIYQKEICHSLKAETDNFLREIFLFPLHHLKCVEEKNEEEPLLASIIS